jgi:hypothetical protein
MTVQAAFFEDFLAGFFTAFFETFLAAGLPLTSAVSFLAAGF